METKKLGGMVWAIVILLILIGLGALIYSGTKSRLEDMGSVSAISANDWAKGAANSKVSLIEYSDFQCPACASYFPIVKQVMERYGNEITFAYRHFPLPQHENAVAAAIAAEASGIQGKFWEMHDLLFENQTEWESLADAQPIFTTYATTLGLDLTKFAADSARSELETKVVTSAQQADNAGVSATPTFFLNGKKIMPRNYDDFSSQIEAILRTP